MCGVYLPSFHYDHGGNRASEGKQGHYAMLFAEL